jgi:O-antigen/teichoic acid export membrane protein
MLNKFLKGSMFYSIGSVLPQVLNFILLPVYSNVLTTNDYGLINTTQAISALLIIVFTLSLDRSIFRLYYEFEPENKKTYLGTIFISILIISTFSLIIFFGFGFISKTIFLKINFYPYIVLLLLSIYFSIFQIIPKLYFQINEFSNYYLYFTISQFVITSLITLFLVYYKKQGAFGYLLGELLGHLIFLPISLIFIKKIISLSFNWKYLIESLKFCIPIIPGLIFAFILNLSDRFYIEKYFNLSEVGVYSLGYKISGLIGVMSSPILVAYSPLFYKIANSENQISAKLKISKLNTFLIYIFLIITFFIVLFSNNVITLFFNKEYSNAILIIPIISFTYFLMQLKTLYDFMIYQKKKTFILMLINFVSAVLTIMLNSTLIPRLGIMGAAYSTFFSFLLVLLLTIFYSKTAYYVKINMKHFFMFIISLTFLFYFFNNIFVNDIILNLLFKIISLTFSIFIFRKKMKLYFRYLSIQLISIK